MPERIASFALREDGGLVGAFATGFAFFDLGTEAVEWIARPEAVSRATASTTASATVPAAFGPARWTTGSASIPAASTGSTPTVGVHMARATSASRTASPGARRTTFYFADTMDGAIFAYDYDHEAGTIANRRSSRPRLSRREPDGATIDAEGYLWNAQWDGWRLVRFAPDGRVDRAVEPPVQKPTSCMFGGAGLDTLYVTTANWDIPGEALEKQPQAGGLLAIDAGVRGLPEKRFAG